MQIGDEVLYVPHTCHAREVDARPGPTQGNLAYRYGWLARAPRDGHDDEMVELSHAEAFKKLRHLRQLVKGHRDHKRLVMLGPTCCWPATVKSLFTNSKGVKVAGLEIQAPNGTVLDYATDAAAPPITIGQGGPHTCHAATHGAQSSAAPEPVPATDTIIVSEQSHGEAKP